MSNDRTKDEWEFGGFENPDPPTGHARLRDLRGEEVLTWDRGTVPHFWQGALNAPDAAQQVQRSYQAPRTDWVQPWVRGRRPKGHVVPQPWSPMSLPQQEPAYASYEPPVAPLELEQQRRVGQAVAAGKRERRIRAWQRDLAALQLEAFSRHAESAVRVAHLVRSTQDPKPINPPEQWAPPATMLGFGPGQ